jgi:dUTP pyrophosphatase
MSNSFIKSIKSLLKEFLKDDVEIKFVPTHPDSKLPKRNLGGNSGTGDSGFDLYSVEDITLEPKSITKVNIGLELSYITPGYWFRIESRSGLYFKNNITSFCGIIDNAYTGRVSIALTNSSDIPYEVKKGDRIAQFVVYPLIEPEVSFTDTKNQTLRGDNGFGSSGK